LNGKQETSRSSQRKDALAHCLGCETQRFVNVVGRQIRIRLQDLSLGHPFRDHTDDSRDGDAEPADTRHSIHLISTVATGCAPAHGTIWADSTEYVGTSVAPTLLRLPAPLHKPCSSLVIAQNAGEAIEPAASPRIAS
jgi:hypothetical protein